MILNRLSIIIIILFIAVNSHSATLVRPVEGTIYKSGESFFVSVDVDQNEQIKMIWLYTLHSKNSVILNAPPFEATFKADDKYIGDDTVVAALKYTNNDLKDMQKNIRIILPDGVTLKEITYYKSDEAIIDTDSTETFHSLYGKYSDGIERKLPNIANPVLEFFSDDPLIVEVDNTGKMYSRKLGQTFITVKSGDVSSKLPVKVFVTLEPPKNFKAVATQTEIQLTWELSPNDPKWVTGYKVHRTERTDGILGEVIGTVTNGTTSFVDTSALPGKSYVYTVQAVSSTLNDSSRGNPKQIGKLLTVP